MVVIVCMLHKIVFSPHPKKHTHIYTHIYTYTRIYTRIHTYIHITIHLVHQQTSVPKDSRCLLEHPRTPLCNSQALHTRHGERRRAVLLLFCPTRSINRPSLLTPKEMQSSCFCNPSMSVHTSSGPAGMWREGHASSSNRGGLHSPTMNHNRRFRPFNPRH